MNALKVLLVCLSTAAAGACGDEAVPTTRTKMQPVPVAVVEPDPAFHRQSVSVAPKHEAPKPGGPALYVRVGEKDKPPAHEEGIEYDGSQQVIRKFKVGKQPYTVTISPLATRGEIKWELRWFRGDPATKKRNRKDTKRALQRYILANPELNEGRGASCSSSVAHPRTDNLAIEVGVRGGRYSARDACAGLHAEIRRPSVF